VIVTRLLSGLFGAGVHFRNQLYDHGRLRIEELRGPVVSVGNISVGGSGKTPFVIMLGEMLKKRGIEFDILSRGYRRETKGVRFVDPDGTAREYGDEPLLMARRLEVPVVVGENRYIAGFEAEKNWGPLLHLLDDAFQHRQLARQFDIVLVTPDDFRDVLLPSGRLREPLSSLERADAVVLTGEPPLDAALRAENIWRTTRELSIDSPPKKPVAFCAIGRPQKFFEQLRTTGANVATELSFRDHHRYTDTDVTLILRNAEFSHADGFITTEKDLINLGPLAGRLSPLSIAKLETSLQNADAALDTILATLKQRGKPVHERIPLA
jgi:tetraacyldisaccharide 4'-kinase